MVDVLGQVPSRLRADLSRALAVVVGCVLLGAPAGLLWAAVAPRLTVTVTADGPTAGNIESSKAFIGADGTYLLVALAFGVACGTAAWFLARKAGPWAVVALAVGGTLAALVQAEVGLIPGTEQAIDALTPGSGFRGTFELFLGTRDQSGTSVHLRAPWAALGWPVGATLAFWLWSLNSQDELD